jgi:DNA-binding transcriptional ArsR family regulator
MIGIWGGSPGAVPVQHSPISPVLLAIIALVTVLSKHLRRPHSRRSLWVTKCTNANELNTNIRTNSSKFVSFVTKSHCYPAIMLEAALDKSTTIDIMPCMQVDPVLFAKALADETRQEIMKQLCCVWLNVNDLVERLDGRVNQPTVSHHLKKLEEAGLVAVRQEGRYRYYSLNQEFLTVCCGALVTNFAPDYRANTIPIDAIRVGGIDRGFDG